MEWSSLKNETRELIANSIGIYYDLKQRNSTYRNDSVAALSLYTGVLRMGTNTKISVRKNIRKPYVEGKPYDNGYYIDNVVCQILNKHNIDIYKVVNMLNINDKYLNSTSSIKNHKIERQYNEKYLEYLKLIRNYYIASLRIKENKDKTYCPEISMNIPNIIVALYSENIDQNLTVPNLIAKISTQDKVELSLKELQEQSTCMYQNKKPLVMNKHLGKII